MDDPTLNSLAQFNDSSKWVIVKNVPIFREHVSTLPDGKPFPIDKDELQKFAAELQRLEQREGVLARLTLGHTLGKDPKTGAEPKEIDQPPMVGFARNAHVGLYGPSQNPAILSDFWYKREDWDTAKQFPYRSPEVYLNARQITGVALLKRDPKLDMGMTIFQHPNERQVSLTQPKAYYQRTDGVQFYALDDEATEFRSMSPSNYGGLGNTAGTLGGAAAGRALGTAALTPFLGPAAGPVAGLAGGVLGNKLTEDACPMKPMHMADDKKPDGAEPSPEKEPSAPPGSPEHEQDGMAAMQDQLAQLSPEEFAQLLQHLTEMYQQSHGAGGAAAPAAAAPAGAPMPASPVPMHRAEDVAHYSRLERENQELKAAVTQLQKFAGDLSHEKMVAERHDYLRGMDSLGFTVTERDFEKASRYNNDLWKEHIESIQQDRPRNHGGDTMLRLADEGTDSQLPDEKQSRTNHTREMATAAYMSRYEKVMDYMRAQGITYEEADVQFDKNGKRIQQKTA